MIGRARMCRVFQTAQPGCMSEDREIWNSAQEMIERYGQDALSQINKRIQELEQLDEADALSVWRQIRKAAETMLKKNGAESKH